MVPDSSNQQRMLISFLFRSKVIDHYILTINSRIVRCVQVYRPLCLFITLIVGLSSVNSGDVAVGGRINAVRVHSQLSSKDFAASLDISPSALYNYEKGVRNISASLLIRIAKKYRVDPFWVMEGPESSPRKQRRPGIERQTLRMAYDVVSDLLNREDLVLTDKEACELIFKAYERFDENINPDRIDPELANLGRIA